MDNLIGKGKAGSSRCISVQEFKRDIPSPKKHKPESTSSDSVFVPDTFRHLTLRRSIIPTETEVEASLNLMDLPSDTEAALLLIRNLFPTKIFAPGSLPPIILTSQIRHVVQNNFRQVEIQLEKLATVNRVIVFSTTSTGDSSNFQIVFYDDFMRTISSSTTPKLAIFKRFVNEVLPDTAGCTYNGSLRFFTRNVLKSRWKFEENEIRQLVNGGYLGIRDGGLYCLSLPGAGRFVKAYQMGNKTILNAIRRAKFGEILQTELERRPMKKSAPLGVSYHLYDLLGSGVIQNVPTTSGALLRMKRL